MTLNSFLLVDNKKNDNIEKDITCPVCQSIIKDPYFCNKCQNNFCGTCIKKWETLNKECPYKCQQPEYIPNRFLSKILPELLKFKCWKDCEKINSSKDADNHYENDEKEDFKEKYNECATQIDVLKVLSNNYKDIEDKLNYAMIKSADLEKELDDVKENNIDLKNDLDNIKKMNKKLEDSFNKSKEIKKNLERNKNNLENQYNKLKEQKKYLERYLNDYKETTQKKMKKTKRK